MKQRLAVTYGGFGDSLPEKFGEGAHVTVRTEVRFGPSGEWIPNFTRDWSGKIQSLLPMVDAHKPSNSATVNILPDDDALPPGERQSGHPHMVTPGRVEAVERVDGVQAYARVVLLAIQDVPQQRPAAA